MTNRPLLIFLVLVALLFSACGNVIAASFCPAYLARSCCIKHSHQASSQVAHKNCDHEMAHMEMADMEMGDMNMDGMQVDADLVPETEASSVRDGVLIIDATASIDQIALESPAEPCAHCWMHSQPSPGNGVAAVNPSPRPSEAKLVTIEPSLALPASPPVPAVRMGHGPPGNSFPRHVLVNVFRI